MKFRGVMVESGCMKEFHNITIMLSKLSRECVMRLTTDKIYFVVTQEGISLSQPPLVWCELDQKAFFNEYTMSGVDDDHNDIYLSFSPSSLNNSLITLKQKVKLMNIKLTKKEHACLSFKIEQPLQTSQEVRVLRHDVPVLVIPRKNWSQYQQPALPRPDISVVMPNLKRIKHILERLKIFSPTIEVQINKSGLFTIIAETDMATVSVNFKNLVIAEDNTNEGEDMISCQIKVKKLHLFLSAEQIQHTRAIFSIKSEHYVYVSLENQEIVNIQCYIPAITL